MSPGTHEPGHPPGPVGYAIDPKRLLSPTPSTPIDDVDGVGDRFGFLSVA